MCGMPNIRPCAEEKLVSLVTYIILICRGKPWAMVLRVVGSPDCFTSNSETRT